MLGYRFRPFFNRFVLKSVRTDSTFVSCKINAGIAIVSLSRPEVKNALNYVVLNQIDETFTEINSQLKNIRVVIIKSAHPGMFCAGADLKERLTMDNLGVQKASSTIRRIFQKIATTPVPIIAAVDGPALGGGTELALACDLRVASSRCVFGMPETGHGIIPGAGGTQRLHRVIGAHNAKDLIFTGRLVYLEEALRLGLVNYGEFLSDKKSDNDLSFKKAYDLALTISEKGPIAISAAKRAIDMGQNIDIERGLKIEETCYLEVAQTTDRIEGLKAFKEKRKPSYKGE